MLFPRPSREVVAAAFILASLPLAHGQTDVRPFLQQAATAKAAGNLSAALTELNRAIKANPNHAEAYAQRAEIKVALEDEAGALADLERAVTLDPRLGKAHLARGRLLQAQGDAAAAVAALDRGLEVGTGREVADMLVRRGLALRESGRDDDAMGDFGRALRADAKHAEAYARATETERRRGNLDAADLYLERWLAAVPEDAEAYFQRALLRCAQGVELATALADLGRAIERDKRRLAKYRYHRGYLRRAASRDIGDDFNTARAAEDPKTGAFHALTQAEKLLAALPARPEAAKLQEAIDAYNRAIALEPDIPGAYRGRGDLRYRQQDLAGSVADFSAALRLQPNDRLALDARGTVHRAMGKPREAVLDYDRILEQRPTDAWVIYNRAQAKEAARIPSAFADYDRAIELEPKTAEFRQGRGRARLLLGHLDQAKADLDQAATLSPKRAAIYEDRGNTHFLARRWSEAVADYQKRIELQAADAWFPRLHLWILRARMDEKERGDRELGAALDAAPSGSPEGLMTLARYLAGRANEMDLLKIVGDAEAVKWSGDYCIVSFMIGMRRLLTGDRAGGIEWLQAAVRTGANITMQYPMAVAELRKLEALPRGLGVPDAATPAAKIMVFNFDEVYRQSSAYQAFVAEVAATQRDEKQLAAEIEALAASLHRAHKSPATDEALSRKRADLAALREKNRTALKQKFEGFELRENLRLAALARSHAIENGFDYACDSRGPSTFAFPLLPLDCAGTDVTAALIAKANAAPAQR